MRSFFAFALFALTSVRAEHIERIFVDGKGVPNLAAASGSNTSPTQLTQAALTGSGSVLSQFSNILNNPDYRNVDVNIFSIKPTRAPPARPPPPPSPVPDPPPDPAPAPTPAPDQVPAPAFGDEVTINGFALGSSGSPATTAASTTTMSTTTAASTTTTSTTTAVPTTSTAAPTATTAAPTAAPTTTMPFTRAAPTTGSTTKTVASTITAISKTSTTTTTAVPTATFTITTSSPAITTTKMTAPTTTIATTTAAPRITTSTKNADPTITATAAPPDKADATAPTAVPATSLSMASSTTKGTTTLPADKDSPQSLTAAATSAATFESSSASNTIETSPLAPATSLSASTAPLETGLIGKTVDKPNGTGKPVSTTPSSPETTMEDIPVASGSSAVIGNTISGTAQVSPPASDVENKSTETAEPYSLETLSSSPEPELDVAQASETTEGSTDSDSKENSSGSHTLGSSAEDPAPTPLFDGEGTESSLMAAPESDTFSSATLGSINPTSGLASTSKKPITASGIAATPDAAMGGNNLDVLSDAVNNDHSKELDIVTLLMTPDPRPSEEGIEEDNLMDYEQASPSPESEKGSEDFDFLIPQSPGRPPLTPSQPETNEGVFDLFSSDSSSPKSTTTFDGLQKLKNKPADIFPSQEPEDSLSPEASAEAPTPMESVLGSMLDSLPAVEMLPAPTSSADETDNEHISFPELVDSLSSFRDPGIIGPVPLSTMEDGYTGMEGSEVLDLLEPTSDAFDVGGFLNSMGEDLMASNEPEISGKPEMSAEPEVSMEILPSSEIELEDVDLIVKYPDSLDPNIIAEEIGLSSNELTQSIQWDEAGLYLVSNLSKFGSAISVVRQADQVSTFELNFQTTCLDPSSCDSELKTYHDFVRDGKMDETLSAHDLAGVNVYIKGDIVDRSTPPGVDMTSTGGLNAGVIAGIAIGAVASVSLLVFGVLFITKRGHNREGRRDPEQGRIESYHGARDGKYQSQHEGEEEGSFMISNFGGSPRNTEALIPWMSNSSEGTGNNGHGSAATFMSVETAGSAELATNYLTNYRFEETTSSASGSDFGDIDVEEVETRLQDIS